MNRNSSVLNGAAFLFFLLMCSCKNESTPVKQTPVTPQTPEVILEYQIKASLGEGPVWDWQNNQLLWVDILGKNLHIYSPETKTNKSLAVPSRIGTVAPHTAQQAVIALEDGIYKIDLQTAALEQISDVEANQPLNRFNDGKSGPAGNLWVGSMNLAEDAATGNLYRVDPKGATTKMLDSITISNGIVWNNSATTMYYIDTPTGLIRAFDYDLKSDSIYNPRVAVVVDPNDGYPDGMAIDANNNLWVGLWNGNAVAQYDAKTGALLQKIAVPAHNVTAAAFGGPDLDVLYITTARVDMTAEELKQFPLAGSVFAFKPGVKGQKADVFGKPRLTFKQ